MGAERYDVVICGGAAMGSSIALHLMQDPAFDGRVLVVEKDPTYRLAASALSAASIRQQYSSPINIRVALHGIAFLRTLHETLAVPGEPPPTIGLHEGGYLYCAAAPGAPVLRANHTVQSAEGADIVLLAPDALRARFPWIAADDLALAAFGASGEGWYDGWGLLQAMRAKARSLGAHYRTGTVGAVEVAGGRIAAVRLADGARVACGTLVNAAGSGGPALAALAGVPLPVQAKRRCVFTFTCREPVTGCPLLIDTSGAYVRPEGSGFLCGISPDAHEDPDWQDDDPLSQEIDWPLFEDRIWPALAHRVPAFEAIRPGRAWTGPYDMCAFDHNALIGPAPELPNFLLCNGFSGHGLQQSPAVGRGLAELIAHGAYRTLDLSDLSYGRLATGRRLVEANVI